MYKILYIDMEKWKQTMLKEDAYNVLKEMKKTQ
jgi:hypothetical protein